MSVDEQTHAHMCGWHQKLEDGVITHETHFISSK